MPSVDRETLGMTRGDRIFVLVAFPLVGAGIGAALPYLWRWMEDAPWVPWRGPISTLMTLDEGWQSLLRIAILAVLGLVAAVIVVAADTSVSIGAHDLVITKDGNSRTYRRDQIAGVYLDGKKLVIETAEGRRLLDAAVDGARTKAGSAFKQFGYPWEND